MAVAVITDSTACIPDHLTKQWDIAVVQVQIVTDDRVDDEVRFERTDIIERLRTGRHVSTNPPSPAAFLAAYQEAEESGATAIVSMHISGRLSATVEAARQAAQQVRTPVYLLDSGTTSMSLGFAALTGARAASAGASVQRVLETADRRYRQSCELLYVETLEYLRRGGRIGAASALLGSALSIKPVLTVAGGEVAPLAKPRGERRAFSKLVNLAAEKAGTSPVDIAVACWQPTHREMALVEQLRSRIRTINNIMVVPASTVIGAHVGPDALGITISPTT